MPPRSVKKAKQSLNILELHPSCLITFLKMKLQIIAPLLLASGVNCWGSLGHATIAYIAQDFSK